MFYNKSTWYCSPSLELLCGMRDMLGLRNPINGLIRESKERTPLKLVISFHTLVARVVD